MAAKSLSFVLFSLVILCYHQPSFSAPSFKFKKSFSAYSSKPARAERRMSAGASSPIHYINPFISSPQSLNALSSFFASSAGSMGGPAGSTVYKLPLKLFTNGKPTNVIHGFPKAQNVLEFLPQAMSKIIRLPLKYLSNAKPVGVYFKNPAYNFV